MTPFFAFVLFSPTVFYICFCTTSATAVYDNAAAVKKRCHERKNGAKQWQQQRHTTNGAYWAQPTVERQSPEGHYYPTNYESAFNNDKLQGTGIVYPGGGIHQNPTTGLAAGNYPRSSESDESDENRRWEKPRKRSRNRKSDEQNGRHGEDGDSGQTNGYYQGQNRRYQSESDEGTREGERSSEEQKGSREYHAESGDRSRSRSAERRTSHFYESKREGSGEEQHHRRRDDGSYQRKRYDRKKGRYAHHRRSKHHRRRPSDGPLPSMRRHRYSSPYSPYWSRPYQPQSTSFWARQQMFPPAIIFQPRFSHPRQHVLPQQKQQQHGSEPTATQQTPADGQQQQQQQKDREQTQLAQNNGTEQRQQNGADQQGQKVAGQHQQLQQSMPQQQQQRLRHPSSCLRKAVEKCSAFSVCVNGTDGTDRKQNCWHEGNDMVFDDATQGCRSFKTLPDCQKESYCVNRPLGPTLVGGACSKVSIICTVSGGTNQPPPFVCGGVGVVHPLTKNGCAHVRTVSECFGLAT